MVMMILPSAHSGQPVLISPPRCPRPAAQESGIPPDGEPQLQPGSQPQASPPGSRCAHVLQERTAGLSQQRAMCSAVAFLCARLRRQNGQRQRVTVTGSGAIRGGYGGHGSVPFAIAAAVSKRIPFDARGGLVGTVKDRAGYRVPLVLHRIVKADPEADDVRGELRLVEPRVMDGPRGDSGRAAHVDLALHPGLASPTARSRRCLSGSSALTVRRPCSWKIRP